MSDREYLVLVDEDGEEYEVDASDCEESEDGSGVYCCFAEDGIDDFFEYEPDEGEEDEA